MSKSSKIINEINLLTPFRKLTSAPVVSKVINHRYVNNPITRKAGSAAANWAVQTTMATGGHGTRLVANSATSALDPDERNYTNSINKTNTHAPVAARTNTTFDKSGHTVHDTHFDNTTIRSSQGNHYVFLHNHNSINLDTNQGSNLFKHLNNPRSKITQLDNDHKIERTSSGHIIHRRDVSGNFSPIDNLDTTHANAFRDHLRGYAK
jgi:hypothetical protein